MAKRGILEHEKLLKLGRLLKLDAGLALGPFEGFLQHVARCYPTGDVSRVDPDVLVEIIRCPSLDGPAFWDALAIAGFVDVLPDGRRLVHDWSEHADDATNMALARKGLRFADGSLPRMTRLSSADRVKAERLFAEHVPICAHSVRTDAPSAPVPRHESAQEAQESAGCAPAVRTACAPPSPPLPSPAMPCTPNMADFQPAHILAEDQPGEPEITEPPKQPAWKPAWETFLALYPARNGDRKVTQGAEKFSRLVRDGTPVEDLLAGVRAYRAWCDANDKTRTELVKQIPTWLNGRCWTEDWSGRSPPPCAPRPNGRKTPQDTVDELRARIWQDNP